MSTLQEKTKLIQARVGVLQDGSYGNKTADAIIRELGIAIPPALDPDWNTVKASSFADPADIRAFKRCKAQGGSDQECFKVGDNGIGAWGHDTTTAAPMVALPREVWQRAGKKGGAKVQVSFKGIVTDAVLGDTMPRLANIKNGAGIDLNPACAKALGLKPPFLVSGVKWRWV